VTEQLMGLCCAQIQQQSLLPLAQHLVGATGAAHLLHCCIIRADGNELCKLVSREGMESGMKLHGSLLSMLQRGFGPIKSLNHLLLLLGLLVVIAAHNAPQQSPCSQLGLSSLS
jgi:hypothetical protein